MLNFNIISVYVGRFSLAEPNSNGEFYHPNVSEHAPQFTEFNRNYLLCIKSDFSEKLSVNSPKMNQRVYIFEKSAGVNQGCCYFCLLSFSLSKLIV